jgi:hypothetical protein
MHPSCRIKRIIIKLGPREGNWQHRRGRGSGMMKAERDDEGCTLELTIQDQGVGELARFLSEISERVI